MGVAAATHLESDTVMLVGDLDRTTYARLSKSPLAWDIETTGLDWREDELRTVQIYDGVQAVVVTRISERPEHLIDLLQSPAVPKVFHHAMFDLRFMAAAWDALPQNVSCTKIAAKLLGIEHAQQSLAPLVSAYLGIALDKSQQVSNWSATELSPDQLSYAVADVWYLGDLLSRLRWDLEKLDRWVLAGQCFAHIPTRVALELQGFDDIYVY